MAAARAAADSAGRAAVAGRLPARCSGSNVAFAHRSSADALDHLDGGEFLQGGSWGQTRSEGAQTRLQGDLETIGEEGDENVRFDAPIHLMIDQPNAQVTLEFFEHLFDLGQLDVPGPELHGIVAGEIGT